MMKILVIKFRNIGDVLLSTPLIRNLKRIYPHARIDAAVNRGTEEMLTLHPDLEKLFVYEREQIRTANPLNRLRMELAFAWEIRRRKYDIVINTTNGDRGISLAAFSGAETVVSFPSKKNNILNRFITHPLQYRPMEHTVESNLQALEVLGKKPLDTRVEIRWPEASEKKVLDLLNSKGVEPGHFVHIHPVSRWLFKCIDDEIMAQIIDYCESALDLRVLLTAAPIEKEQEKLQKILHYCRTEPIDLSGKLTLKETAALNRQALFFIGVDTAIMHISAANDVPVLAFFGPSGAFNWGPWDNELTVNGYRKRNGNQQMGRHRVLQVDWECAPCYRDGCEGSKISDCLMHKGLNIETIRNELRELKNRTLRGIEHGF